MAAKKPTHLNMFFLRSVRIRKEHLADPVTPDADTPNDIMEIVERGSLKRIQYATAMDFIVSGTALENNAANQKAISDAKAEWAEREKAGATVEARAQSKAVKTA